MYAGFWFIWLERNRRIFYDYQEEGVEEIWKKARYWAALWASVTPVFKDYNPSVIMLDLVAAVK